MRCAVKRSGSPNRVLAWCLSALRQGRRITLCSAPSRLGSRAARRVRTCCWRRAACQGAEGAPQPVRHREHHRHGHDRGYAGRNRQPAAGVCVPETQNRTRKWSLQRVGWHRHPEKRYVMGGADASIWLTASGRTFPAWAKPAMWSPGTTSSRHGNAAHCRPVTSSSGSSAPM